MEILFPQRTQDADEALAALEAIPSGAPFAPERVAFVAAVSEAILTTPSFRAYPELMALAFWFRAAHLRVLAADWRGSRHPRGTVLHFAPANVDSVFIYSWFLSLLMGNRNVVRLSARTASPQIDALLEVLRQVGAALEHKDIASGSVVLTYGHDDVVTTELSARCDLRVIWGGDGAVAHLSAIPLPSHAAQVAFPDRFSLAVWQADAVSAADEAEFQRLLHRMFNDAFWFDQRACSSPRVLIWIGGEEAVKKAQQRFWPAFGAYIQERGYADQPAASLMRLTALMRLALMPGTIAQPFSVIEAAAHYPLRVPVLNLDVIHRTLHCGTGWFYELRRDRLDDVPPMLTEKDQTLAVYGFSEEAAVAFQTHLPHAAQRIVPTGEALAFDTVWDGIDLLKAFTQP